MSLLKAGRPTTSKKEKALAAIQEVKEDSIRMNVNISKGLHKGIKQRALDEDTTVTELVIRALNEYLKK